MNSPTEPKTCSRCGAPVTPGALQGLCPRCLLALNVGTQTEMSGDTVGPGGTQAAPSPEPPALEEIARRFPQLEVLEFIGKGGMGAVYKARQKQLDRVVALKIVQPQPGDDSAFAERFTREARALAKLLHPNIVTLFEFGQADGIYYLLMEYVDGVSLGQLLRSSRLSPREALAIVPQICDALQYAHDQGIVHRDIKPENILLDRRGRVKVADFGLAKMLEGREASRGRPGEDKPKAGPAVPTNLTEAGRIMGTPRYMSPEQVEAPGGVDHRADIYALGVVFYQMLTGELPAKPLEPPSRKVQIDVRLDEVVLRALERKPERRYQQASEVKSAVETIASLPSAGEGSPCAPPLMMASEERRRRRRRRMVLITAAALIFLVGLGIWLVVVGLWVSKGIRPPPGLVSWWRAEGDASDAAGTNNGILHGGVTFVPGEVGQALSFDGSGNGYVEVPDSPTLRLTNELTIECWAKRLSTSEVHDLVEKGGDWTGWQTEFEVGLNDTYAGGAHFGFSFAGGWRGCPVTPDTEWHHYAVVAIRGEADPILYIDGVPQTISYRGGPAEVALLESKRPLHIGAQIDPRTGWSYYSSTLIDELAIFNRALSASEIQAIFAAGQDGKRKPGHWLSATLARGMRRLKPGHSRPGATVAPPSGLVSWWPGEGNASDSAGTNNGISHGDVTFVPGEVGQAFCFNGTDSYVEVQDAPCLRMTNELTIELWVKRQDLEMEDYLINKGGDYTRGALNYGLTINSPRYNNALAFTFAGGFRRSTGITDLDWHHVAVVARNGDPNPTFYLDGVEQPVTERGGPPNINLHASSEPLRLGAQVDPASGWSLYSKAVVDEISLYNRALGATEIQAIYAAGRYGKRKPGGWLSALLTFSERQFESIRSPFRTVVGPPPSIVGWWRGEENAGDSAGANHGRLLGNATFAPGKVGQAFCFDPDSGTVVVPDSPSLQLINELTIEAWIKPRSLSGPDGYGIVSKLGFATGNNGYQLLVVGDTLQGLFNSPGLSWPSQRIISGPLISPGVWYHVAFSYDQSAMKLYFDGQLVATELIGRHDIATSASDLHISGADNHCYFDGWIDKASVYNRALSAAEIPAIFSAGQNGKSKSNLGLPANARSGPPQPASQPKEWSPPVAPGQKPDPDKIRAEANALRTKGKYSAALDRYLWYWNHALEYEPGLSAVRLSFLLSDWVELGQRYPKARQALLDIRTRDTQMLLDGARRL